MTQPVVIPTNVIVQGTLSASVLVPSAGSLKDTYWSNVAADRLSADHYTTRVREAYMQVGGSDVANATAPAHVAHAGGTIEAVDVCPLVAPDGGNKAFTVDLQRSANAGNFASVLSAAVTVDANSVSKTPQAATLGNSVAYNAGDVFKWVLTVSGSTGNQGQGVQAVAWFREAPA